MYLSDLFDKASPCATVLDMKCPQCQAINGEHRLFCRRCGFRVMLNCPQCGFANETGDAYCGGCGRNLAQTAPTNVPSPSAARSPSSSSQNLPRAFLEEILKEEPVDSEKGSKDEKKAVTQEEIDGLFDNKK